MVKILSIDGGGIRGVIPAIVLAAIEKLTGKTAAESFDLIAGTSTGGILALGLAHPAGFHAQDLVKLYEEHGGAIFSRPFWRRLRPLTLQKYPSSGIEDTLRTYFGDAPLSEARTDVLVTAYEIERRFPFFFKSRNAREDASYDFPMRLAARATSAAPTYFEPLKIDAGPLAGYYSLVDGGLYANNPAMCAYAEARATYSDELDFLVVSLGTGEQTRRLPHDEARRWGVAQWAKPLLDIVFDGASSTVDYQLRQLLPQPGRKRRYYRFQLTLPPGVTAMDNAGSSHMRELKVLAETMLRHQNDELNELCSLL